MPKSPLLTEDQFRAAAKSGKTPDGAKLRKGFVAEIKAEGDGDSRVLDFTISTDSVDRMGDTIAVDGWKLDNFRRNPVVLWAHNSWDMPVAKASSVRVEDGKLKARAEFMLPEISPFADAVFRAIKGGFLSATSVGFSPIKYAFVDDPERRYGIDFLEQELLEFSIVPVPANAEALVEARAAGLDIAPFREWAEKMLKGEGISLLPTKQLEAIKGLPDKFRSIAKRIPKSPKTKGVRGQLLHCANIAEREIKSDDEDESDEAAAAVQADEAAATDASGDDHDEGDDAKKLASPCEGCATPDDCTAADACADSTKSASDKKPRLDMARRRLELAKATRTAS